MTKPFVQRSTAELYMATRTKLDRVADSMTSGPTEASCLLLVDLRGLVYDLYCQAGREVEAARTREQLRLTHYKELQDAALHPVSDSECAVHVPDRVPAVANPPAVLPD